MRSLFVAAFSAVLALPSLAEEKGDLAAKLPEAKVPLERAITASKASGTPVSAKYEVEDGKLQLSVYTAKGDSFSEVIVDHKTGKVAKSEPITSGDDLTAAKSQSEAMSKAKTSLAAAVSKAVKAHKGYKAVSAMPSVKDGRSVAEITLMKGADSKTVSEKLE
ncbi:MAG: hypothetical protein E6J62_02890, partial [Deltaproteobacteria bacterium]